MSVFTIPPGVPFLSTLVDKLMTHGLTRDPFQLSQAIIYVPTQRAARALGELLISQSCTKALILPQIIPLGEVNETNLDHLNAPALWVEHQDQQLYPPLTALERRLIFTRLIMTWVTIVDRTLLNRPHHVPLLVPGSPADALGLASDLENLMDALSYETIPWENLSKAIDTDYSRFFEITLDFLKIASKNWPLILEERKASDPAQRRTLLIEQHAEHLLTNKPITPIIAAGSTGSMPATAKLLAAIASLPNGAVILPGLDQHLDEASWKDIDCADDDIMATCHTHPQAILKRLLDQHLKINRHQVKSFGVLSPEQAAREQMISHALRPAETTDVWSQMERGIYQKLVEHGCKGLKLIEAQDEREEALAAAIALREVLETAHLTAALVTPHRGFAKRVTAELQRWGIAIDDSVGLSLSESEAGRFARLAADASAQDFIPERLMSLLLHPFVRLGFSEAEYERAIHALDIGVLRGPSIRQGISGLHVALNSARHSKRRYKSRSFLRLTDADWELAETLIQRLQDAFSNFQKPDFQSIGQGQQDLMLLFAKHYQCLQTLSRPSEHESLALDPSFETLESLFDELSLIDQASINGRFEDYPAFFTTIAAMRVVNNGMQANHHRLHILGPLEARLLSADRVILGGLDETIWPPHAKTDAFLNRAMRASIGLTPPERRIGQSAHDFSQLLGIEDVIMTRSMKRDGSPTVPSRFLQRLQAFVGDEQWQAVRQRGEDYRAWAGVLEQPLPVQPYVCPEPKPDPALFPKQLSVTDVETLIRDPYALYAQKILKLDALETREQTPDASTRGNLIHDILAQFTAEYPQHLPDFALEDLLNKGLTAFAPLEEGWPDVHAMWWRHFQRIAPAFLDWEAKRRHSIKRIHCEVSGAISLHSIRLTARADRIEEHFDGSFVIVDYKTGQMPGKSEVIKGFSPQLTLEATILGEGGFSNLRTQTTPDLLYVHLGSGRHILKTQSITVKQPEDGDLGAVVQEHITQLDVLLREFLAGQRGYRSRPFPKYVNSYSPYHHLARVDEWSMEGATDTS